MTVTQQRHVLSVRQGNSLPRGPLCVQSVCLADMIMTQMPQLPAYIALPDITLHQGLLAAISVQQVSTTLTLILLLRARVVLLASTRQQQGFRRAPIARSAMRTRTVTQQRRVPNVQ